MENISKHISYKEATKSNTAIKRGIDNKPSEHQLEGMKLVAEVCFEPLRRHHGDKIGISSFLRNKELNEAVGGSKTSQHVCGEFTGNIEGAIDIDADIFDNGITNKEIFNWLRTNVEFDQIIWEYGTELEPDWVHISYRKGANRGMELMVRRVNGKSVYEVI